MFIKFIFSFLLFSFFYSCSSSQMMATSKNESNLNNSTFQATISHSKSADVTVPGTPYQDSAYAEVLSHWQRDVTLYKDFFMYFSGTAILMSSDMIDAYKKRVEQLQGANAKIDDNIVPKDREIVSVIISLYTSEPKFKDLEETKIWNCAFFYNNKWIQPSSLVRYQNPSSLLPYFSIDSTWSRVYVAQFHVPHFNTDQLKNHETNPSDNFIEFSLHSGLAKANYYWR